MFVFSLTHISAAWRRLACVLFVSILICGAGAYAAVAGSNRQSPIPVDAGQQNPYSYLFGSVAKEDLIRDHEGQFATNVMFQPRYASEVFTTNVLFCGNRVDAFKGIDGPIVVTYKRVPHRLVDGVPCFELVIVDRVESGAAALR